MNKILTILLLTFFSSFAVHAQTEKGSQLLGGSLSLAHTTVDVKNYVQGGMVNSNEKTNTFNIGPSYSYFVADNLGLGVYIGYNDTHTNSQSLVSASDNFSKGYFGSIYLMKYYLFEKKVGIRTGPYAQYGYSKTKYISTDSADNQQLHAKDLSAGIALDFVYFPVRKIALIASLGTLKYSTSNTEAYYSPRKERSFGLNFMNSPSFSVYYRLGK